MTPPVRGSATETGGAEGMFNADAASAGLGITITEFGPGRAQGTMTVTSAMLNGHGTCHGGFIFLFADTVFSCACNSHALVTVAAKAEIVFVSPAYLGDVLVARAEERLLYGRNGVYDISVRRGEGDVVAEFRGHSRSSKMPLP